MAVKFDKLKVGDELYDRHTYAMGNTTIRTIGEWRVRILVLERDCAMVSWNGNRPHRWTRAQLERLYTWSMSDETECEVHRGMMGAVTKVRRHPKAVRDRLKAERDARRGEG